MRRAGWGRERREYGLGKAGPVVLLVAVPSGNPRMPQRRGVGGGCREEEKGIPATCQMVFYLFSHSTFMVGPAGRWNYLFPTGGNLGWEKII